MTTRTLSLHRTRRGVVEVLISQWDGGDSRLTVLCNGAAVGTAHRCAGRRAWRVEAGDEVRSIRGQQRALQRLLRAGLGESEEDDDEEDD